MTTNDHRSDEQPYVPPFIRRLIKDATEEEILKASENLRQYLLILYRIYREHGEDGILDAVLKEARAKAKRGAM
jgi:hypothetical protein